ncbi:HD-GYP domain-containing protein [Photobacterium lipolyticum]|uniref:HD family phosphohydrolase n=1 Tax=Photobacterium lipolyticum TaxID=266810 RepID=A0A2T3MWN2_9GAMM|nr:HD-GYP domain-containing protein [Photobacterium lipolyticum]PSW04395.1 HD family phosphohydrolase [Photobacterium lipolyticum]
MLEKLPVSKIQIGMFVVDVEDKERRISVCNPGVVKHQKALENLRNKGVVWVWIDPTRFVEIGATPSASGESRPSPKSRKSTGFSGNVDQARHLIDESKSLLEKVLEDVYQGKSVDIEPIKDLADDIVNSIVHSPDAFQCVAALRNKDCYLLEHSLNVAFLLVNFGRFLGFEPAVLKDLAVGGVLHDIGKTQVQDEILHKPGKLTAEEFEHMKLHQVLSQPILERFPGLSRVSIDVSLMHHEKLDGSGYPNGLKDKSISLVGRMSSIADIYDALTATRCYKEAMSPAAAFKLMTGLVPHHLDPSLLKQFIRCVGFYPVGSLVKLSDGQVGLVWKSNDKEMTKPVVKCFYSLKFNRYRQVKYINLAKSELFIEGGLTPGKIGIDPTPFR